MPPSPQDGQQGDDTIVVKGEHRWSRLSSPESLSSEKEPLVANLLVQTNPPQPLASPEPDEERPNSQLDRPTPTSPIIKTKANATTMEERLQQMPEKRALPWREGVEEGADAETGGDSRRKQIRFGCLLATRGEVQEPGCNSCTNGRGKFSVCVALDGYFKGACASCQLSGRPNRCSIKKDDDAIPSSATNTPGGDSSFNVQPAAPSSTTRSSGPPKAKRRRTSEGKRGNEVPSWDPQPPQSQAQPQPLQWGRELSSQQHQQANLIPQRPWAAVNQPIPTPPVPSRGPNGNGHLPRSHYIPPTTAGWATVNQPQLQAQPQIQIQGQAQAASSVQPMMQNGEESSENIMRRKIDQEKQESTTGNDDGSVTVIDSLPKNKQRQVYGLVWGLQSGIEHLQRELESLKKALGIDEEN